MTVFKYVIMEATKGAKTVKIPIIFAHYASHKDMADNARHMLRRGQFNLNNPNPVSAGFIDLPSFCTHGESESLNMKSDPDDAEIIKNYRMDWSL